MPPLLRQTNDWQRLTDRSATTSRAMLAAVCAAAAMALALAAGCGTTRSSDSMRTATEQILMSSAIDKAINEINFQPLAGKEVFLDTDRFKGFPDENYCVSTLRQALFANGVILKPDRASAKYILEARAGVLGTNSNSVLIGVPAVNLPNMTGVPGVPTAIPEIPFAKTTRQAGIAKIAMFAYNQSTGKPIWQSGAFPVMSDAKNTWLLGAGPFQRGSIYGGTRFAGSDNGIVPKDEESVVASTRAAIPVTAEAVFDEPPEQVAAVPEKAATPPPPTAGAANSATPAKTGAAPGVQQAGHSAGATPAPAATPPKPPPAAPPPVPPPPPPQPSVPLEQPAPIAAPGILNALGSGAAFFNIEKKP